MRYQKIGTCLLGYLTTGTNVTINLVNIKTDTIIQTTSIQCLESTVLPGLYKFDTELIDKSKLDPNETILEIAYVMTNELNEKYGGKIVIENDLKLLNNLISIEEKINNIPENVWNLLNSDEQESYKKILIAIRDNTELIPALL